MSELIKAIINIKDPFTLLAFFSVVLLFAFRTKAVPELFFGLLKEKLTKERFSLLLHKFMLLGFITFIILCSVAVLGQILAYKTRANPMSFEDFKAEIQSLKLSPTQNQETVQQALKAYQEGITYIERKELDQAIQSIQDSLSKIPTLSAQYTLAYLYSQRGDEKSAKEHATEASILAQTRGSAFDIAKTDKMLKEITAQHIAMHGGLINLSAPENGGEAIAASDTGMAALIDGKLNEVYAQIGSELVISFKEGKSASIERCAWWIGGTFGGNVKDFELLVSDESPTSGFKSIGKFTTQNIRLLKNPYQEFVFEPVRARFVKWKCLSNFGGSNMGSTYGYGLQIYGTLR